MGMAASQAKLLTLTSRLHDVELSAQSIEQQKLALATQKDGLYNEYCDALDAKTIKVAFRNEDNSKFFVDASYSTLCEYNPDRFREYALQDSKTGKVIVSEDIAEMYEDYGNDKYAFAWAVMGFDANFGWNTPEEGTFVGKVGASLDETKFPTKTGQGYTLVMTEVEQEVYNMYCSEDNPSDSTASLVKAKYDEIGKAVGDDAKQQKAIDAFRQALYDNYSADIWDQTALDKQDDKEFSEREDDRTWDEIKGEFNHYVQLWDLINESGGCTTISPQFESGDDGHTWFDNMVNAGLVTIKEFDSSNKKRGWTDTSVATSMNNNYLQEQQIDGVALKKAEAKYKHDLDVLDKKDAAFDRDLSKLETERTAITTEMDSVKKVRDDNEERTFGIFG